VDGFIGNVFHLHVAFIYINVVNINNIVVNIFVFVLVAFVVVIVVVVVADQRCRREVEDLIVDVGKRRSLIVRGMRQHLFKFFVQRLHVEERRGAVVGGVARRG